MAKKFLSAVDFLAGLLLGGSAGTSGQVLTSQGAGNPPAWTTVSGGGSSAVSNVLSSDTSVASDTSYIAASYLQVGAALTVNGNLMVIG